MLLPFDEQPKYAFQANRPGWVDEVQQGDVIVGGQTYLLMFLSEKWAFVAVRCSDEHVSYGHLERYPDVPQDRLF